MKVICFTKIKLLRKTKQKKIKNMSSTTCNNCGKQGHMFHQCKMPITSYGIIAFRLRGDTPEYLMIRRKDSFGFIDFIRGKYSPYHKDQMMSIIDQMSLEEKQKILTESFSDLWQEMWGTTFKNQYRSEENAAQKKFDQIRNGVFINKENMSVCLKDLVSLSETRWLETEWEFPKGRRNFQEKDLDCALREFEEETGISQDLLKVVENLLPFEETFIGTNFKSYKHKYFLAFLKDDSEINLENFQQTEVSKIEWKSLNDCLQVIRPYNQEKRNLIFNINFVLQKYKVIS
jgi:8-oxo-dGTP pyrophosphatase MutT (NUDIX family)